MEQQRADGSKRPPRSGSERRRATKLIVFRVTPAEAEGLRQAADAAKQSVAAYVRSRAVEASQVRPRRGKPAADVEAVRQLVAALNRVGNNLNQIAKAANSGRDVPREEALASFEQVRQIRTEARAVFGLEVLP